MYDNKLVLQDCSLVSTIIIVSNYQCFILTLYISCDLNCDNKFLMITMIMLPQKEGDQKLQSRHCMHYYMYYQRMFMSYIYRSYMYQ